MSGFHQRGPKSPEFEFNGASNYGDFEKEHPPSNRHFIPRYAKLKALGGESISFYKAWRKLQFDMNCVMARLVRSNHTNVSVLPPCNNYDVWTDPKKAQYYDLSVDPCPDCDIRFNSSSATPILAPASILVNARWKKRNFQNTVLLIGTPSHITCAFLHETASSWICEYFDPAGGTGGRTILRCIKQWFEEKLSKRFRKRIRFKSAQPRLNFQADPHDVMCQTWIWFWVYFRVIRRISHKNIVSQVDDMIQNHSSLHIIHLFGSWLSDLTKLGFYDSATDSQVEITDQNTPR